MFLFVPRLPLLLLRLSPTPLPLIPLHSNLGLTLSLVNVVICVYILLFAGQLRRRLPRPGRGSLLGDPLLHIKKITHTNTERFEAKTKLHKTPPELGVT